MFTKKRISSQIDKLKVELDSLNIECEEKEGRKKILNENILALEKKQKEYVDNISALKKEQEEYVDNINYLMEKRKNDNEKNKELAEDYEKNKEVWNCLKNAIDELERNKLLKEREVIDLTESYNNKKVEIALLNEEIEDLEYKKKILKKELENVDFDSLDFIDKLENGYDFEKYIAELLKKLDYRNIEVTPSSGDYGIDVVAESRDDIKWGFQCKLYSNPVGVEAVQQANTGKNHYQCEIVAVVTNNIFTKEAIILAKESNVQLWDREKLAKKLDDIKNSKVSINI